MIYLVDRFVSDESHFNVMSILIISFADIEKQAILRP
jgi:hypothetical protein